LIDKPEKSVERPDYRCAFFVFIIKTIGIFIFIGKALDENYVETTCLNNL